MAKKTRQKIDQGPFKPMYVEVTEPEEYDPSLDELDDDEKDDRHMYISVRNYCRLRAAIRTVVGRHKLECRTDGACVDGPVLPYEDTDDLCECCPLRKVAELLPYADE